MFDYETLNNRRRLEDFLNSEPKEKNNPPKKGKIPKESFIRKTIDYFTGKPYPWLDYSDDKIKYENPRTFLGDIENIKNYLTNLFSKKY